MYRYNRIIQCTQYVIDTWIHGLHESQTCLDLSYWLRKKVIEERLSVEDVRNLRDEWLSELNAGASPDMPGVFVDADNIRHRNRWSTGMP